MCSSPKLRCGQERRISKLGHYLTRASNKAYTGSEQALYEAAFRDCRIVHLRGAGVRSERRRRFSGEVSERARNEPVEFARALPDRRDFPQAEELSIRGE